MNSHLPAKTAQRGVSMIEVLITLVVFSIGLLSVAGLQTISKKSNYDAMQRTQASILAMDMLERMRANSTALSSYVTSDAGAEATPSVLCDATACNPAQLAAWDIYEWTRSLEGYAEWDSSATGCSSNTGDKPECAAGGLAAPTGCIEALGSGAYQVVIAWRGVTAQPEPVGGDTTDPRNDSSCGNGAADPLDNSELAYDDPDESGDDNRMKRIIVMKSHING